MTANDFDKMSKEEYDVDTGTYMEDVHANDSIIGRDADSDGLIDDVEKLLQEAEVKAQKYNEELERQHKEKDREREDEKDDLEAGL